MSTEQWQEWYAQALVDEDTTGAGPVENEAFRHRVWWNSCHPGSVINNILLAAYCFSVLWLSKLLLFQLIRQNTHDGTLWGHISCPASHRGCLSKVSNGSMLDSYYWVGMFHCQLNQECFLWCVMVCRSQVLYTQGICLAQASLRAQYIAFEVMLMIQLTASSRLASASVPSFCTAEENIFSGISVFFVQRFFLRAFSQFICILSRWHSNYWYCNLSI